MMGCVGSSPRGRGTRQPRPSGQQPRRFIPARAGNTAFRSSCVMPQSVHPRAGGEHSTSREPFSCQVGSSPRGRGTLFERGMESPLDRFIPARAGNTNASMQTAFSQSVHPRAGGEHAIAGSREVDGLGSSPRGRGTLNALVVPALLMRFIPARAGNTPEWWAQLGALDGSSPRGRGTRRPRARPSTLRRFIPARAGNTSLGIGTFIKHTVHPRAGGEHLGDGDGAVLPDRFIPARAGNTVQGILALALLPVHPRAGGEHTRTEAGLHTPIGSSPRGRGTRVVTAARALVPRFIPARAGNTQRAPGHCYSTAVHPRAGGEHLTTLTLVPPDAGSSPRGRGTPVAAQFAGTNVRFIPARAGNTRASWGSWCPDPVHPRAGGEHVGKADEHVARFRFIPARAGNTRCATLHGPWGSVHPRAGGEHLPLISATSSRSGSSPRGRGTHWTASSAGLRWRFIPARAGNTRSPGRE